MHRRDRQKGNWFLPGLVAAGMAIFFAFELGFLPVEIAPTETGSLLDENEPELAVDPIQEFDPYAAADNHDEPAPVQVASIPEQFEPNFQPEPAQFSDQSSASADSGFDPAAFLASRAVEPSSAAATPTANPFEQEDPFKEFESDQNSATVDPAAAGSLLPADFQTGQAANGRVLPAGFTDSTRQPVSPASYNGSPTGTGVPDPAAGSVDPNQAADVRAHISQIDLLIDEGDYLTAHSELSRIYWNFPRHRELIYDRIETTSRDIYAARQPHYVKPYTVKPGDQLRLIAREYNVPWQYLAYLNGVSERGIQPGQKLKVNRGPFSAVIDLSDFELTVHAHGYYMHRYPVGIGRQGTTPLGDFEVLQKLENPTYYGPDGVVVDGDDPTNPLGEHWIDLGDGYGLHGTIDPESVGQARSRGCIRMKNQHVAEVYNLLGVGSTVLIRR